MQGSSGRYSEKKQIGGEAIEQCIGKALQAVARGSALREASRAEGAPFTSLHRVWKGMGGDCNSPAWQAYVATTVPPAPPPPPRRFSTTAGGLGNLSFGSLRSICSAECSSQKRPPAVASAPRTWRLGGVFRVYGLEGPEFGVRLSASHDFLMG